MSPNKHGHSLNLEQKQRMWITQHQVQFARALELSAPEFDERVTRELEENPALEALEEEPVAERPADPEQRDATPYYLRRANNASPDDDRREYVQADDSTSLYDDLDTQVDELRVDPVVATLAHYLVASLDSNGYLRRNIGSLADDIAVNEPDIAFTDDMLAEALRLVRSLDPAGIGAIDLQDCLLLQIRRLPDSPAKVHAEQIISSEYTAFTMKHSHKLISRLGLTADEVAEALALIRKLNPKPGSALGSGALSRAQTIIPDFIIDVDGDEITITVNNRIPELAISETFSHAYADLQEAARKRAAAKKEAQYVAERFNAARDFLSLVRHRQETLYSVMTAIAAFQRKYILSEDIRDLRPMGIKDLEKMTGLDASVISRSTNNKYAATPWGVVPLRSFFAESLSDNEEETYTGKEVQKEIQAIVDAEDKRHPLSDRAIYELLLERGYDVARRTISKYRDLLGIPTSRLRKVF